MESEIDTAVLWAAMQHCEDRRDYKALRGHVLYNGSRLAEELSEADLREFAKLLVRATEMWRFEERNGESALLDQKHPDNIMYSQIGGYYLFK